MGDIGDQLRLQTLAFHPLFHRRVHPLLNPVNVLCMVFEGPEHPLRLDGGAEISFCHPFCSPADPVKLQDKPEDHRHRDQLVEPECGQLHITIIFCPGDHVKLQNSKKGQKCPAFPQQRQIFRSSARYIPYSFYDRIQYGGFPECAGLDANRDAHPAEDQQQPHSHGICDHPESDESVMEITDISCEDNACFKTDKLLTKDHTGQNQKRNTVCPADHDLLPVLPAPGRSK